MTNPKTSMHLVHVPSRPDAHAFQPIVTSAANPTLSLRLACPPRSPARARPQRLPSHCPMPPSSGSVGATTPSGTGVPPKTLSNSYRDSTLAVFSLLLAFRIVNALTLRTFFQPDEYFQSLEPAWQLAFGESSNAWITWVTAPPPPSPGKSALVDSRRF